MSSWILVGMMGSGKSSVGRALSARTGRPFVDTDQLLAHRIGRPVRQVFSIYGEHSFRELEHKVLESLEVKPQVVSTGGGVVLREDNWVELRRLGHTLYLRASAENLIRRLTESRSRRPLLEVENWEQRLIDLLEQRKPLYEQADLTIDVDDGSTIEELAGRCEEIFSAREAT